MNSENNSNSTPRLRFPGFTGEWEVVELGQICPVNRGVRVTRKDLDKDGKYPVFQNTSSPMGYYNSFNVSANNPYVIIGGSAGLIGFCNTNFWAADDCAYFEDNEVLDKYFLYATLLVHETEIKNNVRGGNIPRIDRKSLERIKVAFPSLAEQEKIAGFLSAMDALIAAQGQKVEALKERKRGLMQQLFPQPGETTPRLRFPGFTGDWVQKKFKDFTFASGKRNKQNLPYERYSISNEIGFCPQSDQFDGGGGYLKDINCKLYIIVSPHSFAYNPARINVGSIGYQNLGKDVIVSSLYEVFKTNEDCDDMFLWHWFQTGTFHKMVLDVQEGGVRQYFYYDKLRECTMSIPSIPEQKKIAESLSEMDTLIAAEIARMESLQVHKRGLMQQLFPQPSK